MLSLFEGLVEWLVAARRWGRHVWLLRLLMLGSAVVALGVPWSVAPNAVLGVLAAGTGVLGLVWARGHLPVLFAGAVVLWTAVAVALVPDGPDVWLALPVALALVGWHASASVLTVALPWTRVEPALRRRLAVPAGVAAAAALVGAGVGWLSGLVTLPASLTVVALAVLALVAAGGLVLWPVPRDR